MNTDLTELLSRIQKKKKRVSKKVPKTERAWLNREAKRRGLILEYCRQRIDGTSYLYEVIKNTPQGDDVYLARNLYDARDYILPEPIIESKGD